MSVVRRLDANSDCVLPDTHINELLVGGGVVFLYIEHLPCASELLAANGLLSIGNVMLALIFLLLLTK